MLKGSAVAHLDYPDPSLRTFGDVDLLVRSRDIDAAVAVLAARGARPRLGRAPPGFDRRFGKGATFTHRHGPGDRPAPDVRDGAVRTADAPGGPLGAAEDTFDLAGRPVRALDAECRFLHACFHAALGNAAPRLVPLRDVAQMLLFGGLDMDRVDRLMRAWQAEAVVARAVQRWPGRPSASADITALSTLGRTATSRRRGSSATSPSTSTRRAQLHRPERRHARRAAVAAGQGRTRVGAGPTASAASSPPPVAHGVAGAAPARPRPSCGCGRVRR